MGEVCLLVCVFVRPGWRTSGMYRISPGSSSAVKNGMSAYLPCRAVRNSTAGRLCCIPYAAPLNAVQSSASNRVEGSGHVGHGVLQRVVSCCKMHCRNYSHLPRPRFQVDMLRVDRRKPIPATVNRLQSAQRRLLTREMPSQAAPQCIAEMQRRPLDVCAVRAECAVATAQCSAAQRSPSMRRSQQLDRALLCQVSGVLR